MKQDNQLPKEDKPSNLESLIPQNPTDVLDTAYMGEGASTYDEVRFTTGHGLVFHELELDQVKSVVAKLAPNATVLEVGCGTARFSQHLAQAGFNVVALDPSPDMLAIAKKKCGPLTNIKFTLAEGAALQFEDGTFDFVFAIRVINSTESEEYAKQTIKEMIRVCKPGGLILIEFANKSRPFAKLNNSVRLSFNELRELAALNGCEVVKQSGVLVFSQTILNGLPAFLLPLWKSVEAVCGKVFYPVTSRGYITFRKQ